MKLLGIYLRVEGQTETKIGTVAAPEEVPALLRVAAFDLETRMLREEGRGAGAQPTDGQ